MSIAGDDLKVQAPNACHFMGPQRPALERQANGQAAVARQRMEVVKLFDNLYFMGYNDIGAWAITTSDGIILLDTLNSPQEGEEIIAADSRRWGSTPSTIKIAIIGHGHFDHFGGAPYFQQRGVPIALTATDWDLIERLPPNQTPQQAARPRPTRDRILTDGQKVTVGDTTVTILTTPGHTEGAVALIFPVKEKGRTYNALLLSGANQTPNPASLAAFEKALATAKREKAALLAQRPSRPVWRRDRVDGDDPQESERREPVCLRRGTLCPVHRHHDRVRPRPHRRHALQAVLKFRPGLILRFA